MRKAIYLIVLAASLTVHAADGQSANHGKPAALNGNDQPPQTASTLADGGTWTKLTSLQPEQTVVWNGDDLIIDFGVGRGLWLYDNGQWTSLTPGDADLLVVACAKLFATFVGGDGLWLYDDTSGWTLMTSWSPVQMVSQPAGILADFGGSRGLWEYACDSQPAESLDLYVDATLGDDANDGLSPDEAKRTIQAAVNAVPIVLHSPAIVHIADGTYHESVLIDRRILSGPAWPPITLLGNETSPQNVVLDGEGALEQGVIVLGWAAIRGIEATGYLEEGFEVDFGYLIVEKCRVIGNANGANPPWGGIGVFTAGASITDTLIADNGNHGIEIGEGWFNVGIENVQITGNTGDGIHLYSSGDLSVDGSLLIQSNGGVGVFARDKATVDFNGSGALTIQSNVGGSMNAEYLSTIRGYGSGTTGSCVADASSICEP